MHRNILTIKNHGNLSDDDRLLYEPYRDLVEELYEFATKPEAKSFDIVTREFSGMNNADSRVRHYYEALMGVTSYFQASKGGRGKYIEKKLASASDKCALDCKLSDLPKLFLHTDLVRNQKLFGQDHLTAEERETLRLCDWDFIGSEDHTTDLCNLFLDEGTLSFLELKNRIDSGGVSARREIFHDKKFKGILALLIDGTPLYRWQGQEYSLLNFYKHFGIKKITLSAGILFDSDGAMATLESDRSTMGFYSVSKDGFRDLHAFVQQKGLAVVYNEDTLTLQVQLPNDFEIHIQSVYGKDIPRHLFHKEVDINLLIKNKFDDLWLFQLLAIDERHALLKHGANTLLRLQQEMKANHLLRQNINQFINEDGQNTKPLGPFVSSFPLDENFIPSNRTQKEYVMDNLYFISAAGQDI